MQRALRRRLKPCSPELLIPVAPGFQYPAEMQVAQVGFHPMHSSCKRLLTNPLLCNNVLLRAETAQPCMIAKSKLNDEPSRLAST